MYFTDRGIEELESRRGEEEVSFLWLAERLRTFVDPGLRGARRASAVHSRASTTTTKTDPLTSHQPLR